MGAFRELAKEALGPALMAVHGESCKAHLPTGGVVLINARPFDAKLIARTEHRKQALGHRLVLQVAKEELPAIVKQKTLITFPGEWVGSSEPTVKWVVTGTIDNTASPAHWFLGMAPR